MILFSFAFRPLSGPHLVVNGARWVFEVCSDHIGFTEQRRYAKTGEWVGGGWMDAGYYYWVATCRRGWGYFCAQYDGFHEMFRVGGLCVTWCHSFDGDEREWPWS